MKGAKAGRSGAGLRAPRNEASQAGCRGPRRYILSERSEGSHAIGPPTPRLRRGLAVALRAKADASEPTRPAFAPSIDRCTARQGLRKKTRASAAKRATRTARLRAKPLGVNMESGSRVVTVEIHGQQYPIRSGLDPAYVAELAKYVDDKMQLALRESPAGDTLKLGSQADRVSDDCIFDMLLLVHHAGND